MHILVLNCGSSSVKFAVVDADDGKRLLDGEVDALGSDAPARFRWSAEGEEQTGELEAGDHAAALRKLAELIEQDGGLRASLKGVGHRVVHGGEAFAQSVRIDAPVLERIEALSELAPLHNPSNLLGIRTLQQLLPELPHVAGLHELLARRLGLDLAGVTDLLNRRSGLLGLSELSNDARDLTEAADRGHEGAMLALEIFSYRLAKSIAALVVPLGRLDALVFTGGIGENATDIRAATLSLLTHLGLELDPQRNQAHGAASRGLITSDTPPVALVIPTDEERIIAADTAALLRRKSSD